MTQTLAALGLMSGTSLDGIDVAYLRTDGVTVIETGPWATFPYEATMREAIRSVLGGVGPVSSVEELLTRAHAEAVDKFLAESDLSRADIDLVGFHGHTILHRPEEGRTWQIGDGGLLGRLVAIPVINDFRSADVAAGGQGAPLVPLFHAALAHDLERPLAVLNLGGVANVTWIGADDSIVAFDTGPGNAPLDDWVRRRTGRAMDDGGRLAAAGRVDAELLATFLRHPYFDRAPPKSLDRDDFTWTLVERLNGEDGAATLVAIITAAVARAAEHFPARVKHWLVTGGGRHNPAIMAALSERLDSAPRAVEAVGWNGDALEAQAFAYLAVRSQRGLPLSLPSTTGVPRPLTGGRYHPLPER
ncbi:MAG TPA: anhydro-N-acetylmuramic acid kinase [Alphaproteobacteria bacterium]|nr:anhydro-N-acetylmuramic acid kinase [Alphaproteobacteria bacterium]